MVPSQFAVVTSKRAVGRRQVAVSAVDTLPRERSMETVILPGSRVIGDARHTGVALRSVHMASAAVSHETLCFHCLLL